jgi:hypothetical protein
VSRASILHRHARAERREYLLRPRRNKSLGRVAAQVLY